MTAVTHLAAVAGVYAALHAAHQVGDHWIQSGKDAAAKGNPGPAGRAACARHVTTYTATGLVALVALAAATGWQPDLWRLAAGLAVSAVTHYIADRRTPLEWLAEKAGKDQFVRMGRPVDGQAQCMGTGAYLLDQSWHTGWLYVTALIIGA